MRHRTQYYPSNQRERNLQRGTNENQNRRFDIKRHFNGFVWKKYDRNISCVSASPVISYIQLLSLEPNRCPERIKIIRITEVP